MLLCIHLCLLCNGQKHNPRESRNYSVLTQACKLLKKALLSLGLTATEQCHFPASKQEGSIVHPSQRECSAISLDYLAPQHFANKLQPGPKLPQCWLCHAGPPLRRYFKIQALLPPQLTHISSGTGKARIRPIFPFLPRTLEPVGILLSKVFLFLLHPGIFSRGWGVFSSFEPIQPSPYSELLFSLFTLPHLSPDLLRYWLLLWHYGLLFI